MTHGTVPQTVVVAERDRGSREAVIAVLHDLGYKVLTASDGAESLTYLTSDREVSAILFGMERPDEESLSTLHEIREIDARIPVIAFSERCEPATVVQAIKRGATDFLVGPVRHEELSRALREAIQARRDRESSSPSQASSGRPAGLLSGNMFFGRSAAMEGLKHCLATVAASNVPVLIEGETGSGKEMLARQLHNLSPFAERPFIKLNCAAVPSELMESELFGYERGAFTGAFQRKPGVFELADGGTLLLDEIGDMDIRLQAKLLQVLQDQEFRRLGGRETIRVQVRVLSATHCNLLNAVAEKAFREDLYYRLNVFTLRMPALRDRKEDIVGIAEFLMRKHATLGNPPVFLTARLKQALTDFSWPGNIRQLENTVRKLLVLRDANAIAAEIDAMDGSGGASKPALASRIMFPPSQSGYTPSLRKVDSPASTLADVARVKNAAETEVILAALDATHWNRKLAAARLQIDYKAFLYRMRKLSIDQSRPRRVSA